MSQKLKLRLKNPSRASTEFSCEFPLQATVREFKAYLSLVSFVLTSFGKRLMYCFCCFSLFSFFINRIKQRKTKNKLVRKSYPGQPAADDQKLVFAGHLLNDQQTLEKIFESVYNSVFVGFFFFHCLLTSFSFGWLMLLHSTTHRLNR